MFHSADGHILYVQASHANMFVSFTVLKDLFRQRNNDLYQRTLSHQSRVFSCHKVSLVGDLTPGYGL